MSGLPRQMQDWPLLLTRVFDHAEREHSGREVASLQADGTMVRSNWGRIASDGRRMAKALRRLGVKPGDRVGSMAMSHLRHLVLWVGTMGTGAIVHTINPRLFDDQLVFVIEDAADRILFYDPQFEAIIERLRPRLTNVATFIPFDALFDALVAAESDEEGWLPIDERAPAMLCYTGGTTGNPKGVIYEHRSHLLHVMTQVMPDVFDFAARSSILPNMPMFHCAAGGFPFGAALTGAKLVLSTAADPATLHRLILEEDVTHSSGVPTIWSGVLQHEEIAGGGFNRLNRIMIGGSAAPRSLLNAYLERGIFMAHIWGMTEMSPVGTVTLRPGDWDDLTRDEQLDILGKQGKPVFGVELRTVDEEGTTPVASGESGHLQSRGPSVIERYFGHDAIATHADGWFDTGDIAQLDETGTMRITDRAKDLIKSGGEWISSVDLENSAMGCPGVLEAAAIPVPDEKWGERPHLFVIPKTGASLDEDKVKAFLKDRIARWWMPDRIHFVDELPRTGTGKVMKTELRRKFQATA